MKSTSKTETFDAIDQSKALLFLSNIDETPSKLQTSPITIENNFSITDSVDSAETLNFPTNFLIPFGGKLLNQTIFMRTQLLKVVSELKHDWKKISAKLAIAHKIYRTPSETRELWKQLRGSKPKKLKCFTKEEDKKLMKLVSTSKKLDWLKFSQKFPQRSPLNLKNRYYYLLKRNIDLEENDQVIKIRERTLMQENGKNNYERNSLGFSFKKSYDLCTLISDIEISI